MDQLDYPLKAEVQAVREIIKGVNKDITEEIKWNAPSYSYKGSYLVTFNLHAKERVHLVFHNPQIARVKHEILEGNYPDRHMVYLSNMQDVEAKKASLEIVLKELLALVDP